MIGFATMLVLVGIGEEGGWSAFAAPTLLERHGLLAAWSILSAIRIAWHVPLMLSGELPWVTGLLRNAGFQLVLLVLLVLFSLPGSRWSLAAVWHASLNAFGGGFFFAMVTGADRDRLGLLLGLAYAVLGVLAYTGWRLAGSRRAGARRAGGSDPSRTIPVRDQSAASV